MNKLQKFAVAILAGTPFSAMLIACVSLFGISTAFASSTGQGDSLDAMLARSAPLTLSANGQWRLHVDAKNVLHRVNLADARQEQSFALPFSVGSLAASRSGLRVAFTTSSNCVGLVDFSAPGASAASLRWLPGGPPLLAPAEPAIPRLPQMPAEHECGSGNNAIALSSDGRLLATQSQVYDIDAKKVVASLPVSGSLFDIGRRFTLKLQFADNNTKLLTVTATSGEGDESLSTPSNLQFAVWSLPTKSLHNLISLNDAGLITPLSFFAHYSEKTGVLYWVDDDRYRRGMATAKEGDAGPPLRLMQQALNVCGGAASARFPLKAWDWESLVIDPHGRWVAGMHKVDSNVKDPNGNSGFVDELVVHDIDSRKQIGQLRLKQRMRGLVASDDGSTIFGMTEQPLDPSTGLPGSNGGDIVKFAVDLRRVATPEVPTAALDPAACKIEDETTSARSVVRARRLLRPLWSLPIKSLTELRQEAVGRSTAKNVVNANGTEAGAVLNCTETLTSSSFIMHDHTIWLDKYSEIAMLDPKSGRTIKTHPTARKPNLCSIPLPAADGFINYQGDTLSWRPFDGNAADRSGPARHVIEARPGWNGSDVRPQGRGFVVIWMAKPGNSIPKDKNGLQADVRIASYDAAELRLLGVRSAEGDSFGMIGDETDPGYAELFRKPCSDYAGTQTSGYDWRLSYFDSFRAYACGASAAETKTIFWSNIDIAPRSVPPSADDWTINRRVWALDNMIGVAQDGTAIRVFDIVERREIGQIATSSAGAPQAVQVIASEGLVLIESLDNSNGSPQRYLRAYSFRQQGGVVARILLKSCKV